MRYPATRFSEWQPPLPEVESSLPEDIRFPDLVKICFQISLKHLQ